MDRKDKIKALVDKVSSMNRGDVITYEEIAQVIEDSHGSTTYNDVVQAAKKHLVTDGNLLENVRGVGYKLTNPDDYTYQGVKLVKAGARRIDRGVKVMRYAPVNEMSGIAREAHNRVYDRMMNLQAAMAGASVEIKMMEKQREHPLLAMK